MNMQILHIPTKKENYAGEARPHSKSSILCASGHALISSGGVRNYSPAVLSKSTTASDAREGSDMDIQMLRIPTKG